MRTARVTITTVATALFLLAFGTAARADSTLFTAPLEFHAPNEFLCLVTNVGSKDVDLSFEIFSPLGTSIYASGPLTLASLRQTGIAISAGQAPRICKVVIKGSKNSVRVSACVRDAGGTCIAHAEAH